MSTSSLKISILVLVFVIALAACSNATSNQTPSTPTASPTAAPSQKPSITLQPCKLGSTPAQCGTLRVYENRAARSGRMIDLRVAVIKASSDHPAPDPIFYLSGGPGAAATEEAASGVAYIPSSLSQNHDVVFVDQRGTGGSNQILIPTDQPDLSGLTPEETDAKARAWVTNFLATIDMDPRFYTTSVAMDDLDEVREALGYDKINLVGYSYGATAAQYYLRQHEDHVRTVTLSGGSLLDTPLFEMWARNGQLVLDRLFDHCQADPACHAAFPDLRTEFTTALESLKAQPVVESRSNVSVTFTSDLMAETIRVLMIGAQNDAALPLLIHKAYQENDWTGITDFYYQYGPGDWGPQIMAHVIRCGEKWASFDPEVVSRLSEGSYLKGWYVSLAQNHAFSCKYTPRGETPEELAPQPGSQAPVLIMNGELDPQVPPEDMAGAQALWPNSISVTLPYQRHWAFSPDAATCYYSIMSEFIQTGSAQGLHTDCIKKIEPLHFKMP